jgi:hypothetical protein
MSLHPTPASIMQTEAMRAATTRAERTITRHTGIDPDHSRDLACELGLTFALAAVTAMSSESGGAS